MTARGASGILSLSVSVIYGFLTVNSFILLIICFSFSEKEFVLAVNFPSDCD
mgnify:CR=1 FL=1|jgi:hypothetical protein